MTGAHPNAVGVEVVRTHAFALARLGRDHDLTTPVPTCGDWTLAELVWHLAEVHDFWLHTIANRPAGPDTYDRPERPFDGELSDLLDDRCSRLTAALDDADPGEHAWSWADDHTVGFTVRRQSHEALIHHLDGELAVGSDIASVDPELAADGVDELVRVMLTGVPDWAGYETTTGTVLLRATDTGDAWTLEYGRMTGTSPDTGTDYDLVAMEIVDETDAPSTTVAAPAFQLDRWLWGRGGAVDVTGEPGGAERLRRTIVECTG